MNKKSLVRIVSALSIAIVFIGLAVLFFIFKYNINLSLIVASIFLIAIIVILISLDSLEKENIRNIDEHLDNATRNALMLGNIGIVVYNDEFEINWMSSFFENRNMNHIGEKLLNWVPELQEILNGEVDKNVIVIDNNKFEINKMNNASVLIFKDVTEVYDLSRKINEHALVIGLVGYDNLDESSVNEDELTYINMYIKMPVVEYFKKYNCVYKTLKNNRLLLVLDETIFKQIYEDRFSILKEIRNVSNSAKLDVTLSLAFARGSNDLNELDDCCDKLLDLAQTRGGDQVVVRKIGEDPTFFGGGSEAREKQSKTKVRVTVTALRDLINKCENVIVVGHKDADADCIGSAICISNTVLSMNKPVYIITKSGGVEPMISEVLAKYNDDLSKKHQFIDETSAMELLNDNTLVIMVDHHSKEQSNGSNVLSSAKKIVIIDHHRRKADLDVNPIMFYIEASASSTCEMVCEFLPYMSKQLEITNKEANIMYIGISIDTDRFRVRTGARTFDVLKQLKQYGADSIECDELSQEPYNMIINRSHIINAGKKYHENVIIASISDDTYNRSVASQACDTMIKAKDIEAAFVICSTSNDETIITARSKGQINVQIIMEKMDGGGHMTAAGLQRKDVSVAKLENELLNVLDDYFKEATNDESNIA